MNLLKFYRIRRRIRSIVRALTELREELIDDPELYGMASPVETLRKGCIEFGELWEARNVVKRVLK